jgi:hypothetical protein
VGAPAGAGVAASPAGGGQAAVWWRSCADRVDLVAHQAGPNIQFGGFQLGFLSVLYHPLTWGATARPIATPVPSGRPMKPAYTVRSSGLLEGSRQPWTQRYAQQQGS